MSSLNSYVYYVDRRRKIFFWNKAAELLTGYSSEKVVGSSCSENILRHITAKGKELCLHGCPLVYPCCLSFTLRSYSPRGF
ncbi:MAG: PAS domain-containing protein [Spirochaetia bacterium]|nr:PAS domain-containing protein [Spirochaetia bacterium]